MADLDSEQSLKAAVFQRLHPHTYLERFLAENVRPDGRTPDAFRPVTIHTGSISTAFGSALVRLGGTTVVCGITAEIAEPTLEKPREGYLVPNLDLPALCSPRFKPGPPSEEAQVLSESLHRMLSTSNVVPLESLCIAPGKAVWVVYIDATCINYDGSTLDAALLAMVAALKNARIPKARYDEESERTICSRRDRSPLSLTRIPISTSFGLFQSTLLADPTSFEEPLLDTSIAVVHDTAGNLLSVSQRGPASEAVLARCTELALSRSRELAKEFDET